MVCVQITLRHPDLTPLTQVPKNDLVDATYEK